MEKPPLPLLPLPRPVIEKVQEKLVGRKNKKIVYEITYTSGEKVVTLQISTPILMSGGVEFQGAPIYCHPCRAPRAHLYYHNVHETRCLCCDNRIGERDTRPVAKVLSLRPKSA